MKNLLFIIFCVAALSFVGCSSKGGCGCCSNCTGLVCEDGRCTPCNCGCANCTCPGGAAYQE